MPHAKLWLGLVYPGGRRKQLWKVLKCINRCFYWSRATIFRNIFSSGDLLLLTGCPLALLCGQQRYELVILQHVDMRTPLAAATTKPMENTSCTTATHVQFENSHFQCKAVQSIPSSVTGCSRGTWTPWSIKGGASGKKDSIQPCAWIDLPWKCCSAAPPLSSCKPGPWAGCQLTAGTAPWPMGAPAQFLTQHMLCCAAASIPASSLPRQLLTGRREPHCPEWELGFWQRVFLSPRQHQHFLKCFMPKGTFTTCL